jgi:hypothetical protein
LSAPEESLRAIIKVRNYKVNRRPECQDYHDPSDDPFSAPFPAGLFPDLGFDAFDRFGREFFPTRRMTGPVPAQQVEHLLFLAAGLPFAAVGREPLYHVLYMPQQHMPT